MRTFIVTSYDANEVSGRRDEKFRAEEFEISPAGDLILFNNRGLQVSRVAGVAATSWIAIREESGT